MILQRPTLCLSSIAVTSIEEEGIQEELQAAQIVTGIALTDVHISLPPAFSTEPSCIISCSYF